MLIPSSSGGSLARGQGEHPSARSCRQSLANSATSSMPICNFILFLFYFLLIRCMRRIVTLGLGDCHFRQKTKTGTTRTRPNPSVPPLLVPLVAHSAIRRQSLPLVPCILLSRSPPSSLDLAPSSPAIFSLSCHHPDVASSHSAPNPCPSRKSSSLPLFTSRSRSSRTRSPIIACGRT